MNRFVAYNMPKIELHCHLDGSMSPKLVAKLLEQRGEHFALEQIRERLEAKKDCHSLAEYLTCFDLPIRCLQTREGLALAAEELALLAAKEKIKYLEVRFAPAFSTKEGLSIREILESVRRGLKSAEEKADILTGMIVCGMRHLSPEENLGMLRESMELFGHGVVGCDLAGDEKAFPTADFADFFAKAKNYKIPYTIHSGECGSSENIKAAIEMGASRLGHGIAMSGHPELMELCVKKGIGVEMCPTSNYQTKAVTKEQEYPFREFFDAGIPLSVNTDNRTVSQTTVTDEFMLLSELGMMNERISERIYKDSVAMSFATDEIKHKLLQSYEDLFVL